MTVVSQGIGETEIIFNLFSYSTQNKINFSIQRQALYCMRLNPISTTLKPFLFSHLA
jgi:hypothetical protein